MKILTRSVCIVLCAAAGQAQGPVSNAATPIQLGDITFTGSLRSRVYFWDWFQPTAGENAYQYSGNLLRLGLSEHRDTWDWDAEFAVPFLLGLPASPTGTGAQQGALGLGANYLAANSGSRYTAMIFPKQFFVRFDGLGGNRNHALQVGRFEFLDGRRIVFRRADDLKLIAGRMSIANLERIHGHTRSEQARPKMKNVGLAIAVR